MHFPPSRTPQCRWAWHDEPCHPCCHRLSFTTVFVACGRLERYFFYTCLSRLWSKWPQRVGKIFSYLGQVLSGINWWFPLAYSSPDQQLPVWMLVLNLMNLLIFFVWHQKIGIHNTCLTFLNRALIIHKKDKLILTIYIWKYYLTKFLTICSNDRTEL